MGCRLQPNPATRPPLQPDPRCSLTSAATQADSRQLDESGSGLTGSVVWVCPGGDTLELNFLELSPDALEATVAAASAAADATADDKDGGGGGGDGDDAQIAGARGAAPRARRGSLLSLMTAATPVEGVASVGAKEQVSMLLGHWPSPRA